MGIHPRLMSI